MNNAVSVLLYGKKEVDISSQLLSLITEQEVNQIPFAELVIATGDFAERKYPLFEGSAYKIGEELEIKVRYEVSGESEKSVFKGVITKRKFQSKEGTPVMVLGLSDPAFRLVNVVNTKLFHKKNSKQMIEQTLTNVEGVSLQKASAGLSSVTFFQYVKKQNTDWQFICDQVASYGMLLSLDNGKMQISKPDETQGAISLDIGVDPVIDLSIEEDAENLFQEVVINYWNVEKNKEEELKKTLKSAQAKASKAPKTYYVLLGITDKAEAKAFLESFETQQLLNQVKGSITIPGDSSVKLMQNLTLKSLPAEFNGSYPVTSIVHEIANGAWITKIGIGNTEASLLKNKQSKEVAGFQNKNLEIATALKWEKDPENLGRVPVNVMAFGKEKYWAYPAQMAAGKKQRSFILPEEGEQVVVGFLHNNYNQGVIVTSLYLKTGEPKAPFKFDAKSPVGFVSSNDMRLVFDDEKEEVLLTTPKENTLSLSDKKGMDLASKDDLTIKSKASFSVKASGKVTVKGRTIDLN